MPSVPSAGSWRVSVLGPTLLAEDCGTPGPPTTLARQDLRVLTALATLAHGDQLVDTDLIEAAAWDSAPTDRALRSAVYRLRAVLGASSIETRRGSIRLTREVLSDLAEFEGMAAVGDYDGALALVRGEPFATMGSRPLWREQRGLWRQRIETLRDLRVQHLLDHRRFAEAVDVLIAQLTSTPLVGFRWNRLVDSLVGLGRRVDALRAIDQARQSLGRAGRALEPSLLERERILLAGDLGEPTTADLRPADSRPHSPPPGATMTDRPTDDEAIIGRDEEVDDGVRAIVSGTDPVIVICGQPGMGTMRVGRALLVAADRRGWRVVIPGAHADLSGVWGSAAETDSMRRGVVVAIDLADHDPGHVRRLARQAAANDLRRVLLRVVESDGSPSAPLEVLLDVPVHVVRLGPLGEESMPALGRQAAELLGAGRLAAVTGGVPSLVRMAASLAESGVPAGPIEREMVLRRSRCLGLDAARLLGGLALIGGGGTRQQVSQFGLAPGAVPEAVMELAAHGWIADATSDHVSIAPALVGAVVDSLDPAVIDDLVQRVLSGLADTVAGLGQRVDLAALTGRSDCWLEAAAVAARLPFVELESDVAAMAGLIGRILDQAGGDEPSSLPVAALRSRLGIVARLSGESAQGWKLTADAYRRALRSGDIDDVFTVVRDSVYPLILTVTDDGEPSRALVRAVLRRHDLRPQLQREAVAIDVYHELARGDRRALSKGLEVFQWAKDLGDDALAAAIAHHLTSDLCFERGATAPAEFAYRDDLARGELALAARSIVYQLCAAMRSGRGTFSDPLLTELLVLVDEDRMRSAAARGISVLGCAALLRVSVPWPLDLRSLPNPSFDAPLVSRLRERFGTLLASPDWTAFSPTVLVGDPHAWRVSAPIDLALWRAGQAAEQGERDRAATEMARALVGPDGEDRDMTMAVQSAVVVSRLPIACQVVRRIGDRDLAARVLEAHLGLRGLDLSMLPGVHLGPACSWLAAAADVAGDHRAAALHAEATTRLEALDAHVLETA